MRYIRILLIILLILGIAVLLYYLYPTEEPEPIPVKPSIIETPPPKTIPKAKITAQIFFLSFNAVHQGIAPVKRQLPADVPPLKAALDELIGGKLPEDYRYPLPEGVKVLSAKLDNGIATVDFSQELLSNFKGGSDNEATTVYAIVNTLCSLPGVEKVQILINGKIEDSLGGHLGIDEPLAYNDEWVMQEAAAPKQL